MGPCLASPTTSPRSAVVSASVGVARCIASRGGQDASRPRFCGRTAADERRLRAQDRAINGNRAVALSQWSPAPGRAFDINRAVAPGHRLRAPGRAFDRHRVFALNDRQPHRAALSRAIVMLLRAICGQRLTTLTSAIVLLLRSTQRGSRTMQSTGQGGKHRPQPVHSGSMIACMAWRAPTMASTGHAWMHLVQPMQSASITRAICGTCQRPRLRSNNDSAGVVAPSRCASARAPRSPPGGQRSGPASPRAMASA